VKDEFDSDLEALDYYLKLTGSIRMLLIPGSELFAANKTYTWVLEEYSSTGMKIKLDFDYPEFISIDAIDTM